MCPRLRVSWCPVGSASRERAWACSVPRTGSVRCHTSWHCIRLVPRVCAWSMHVPSCSTHTCIRDAQPAPRAALRDCLHQPLLHQPNMQRSQRRVAQEGRVYYPTIPIIVCHTASTADRCEQSGLGVPCRPPARPATSTRPVAPLEEHIRVVWYFFPNQIPHAPRRVTRNCENVGSY